MLSRNVLRLLQRTSVPTKKPEDAPLFTAMFKILSPTTIYYRFFGMLKELKPEMPARSTQNDCDREVLRWSFISEGAGHGVN